MKPAMTQTMIPVFLPGNQRDFTEIKGVATISETGEVSIILQRPEHAKGLADLAKEGRIIALSFDYLPEGK